MILVSRSILLAALVAAPHSSDFTIRGFQTAEDARAFHTGKPTLLDEIEEWLDDNLPGERALAAYNDFHHTLYVAILDPVDAVTFKLAWGEDTLGG